MLILGQATLREPHETGCGTAKAPKNHWPTTSVTTASLGLQAAPWPGVSLSPHFLKIQPPSLFWFNLMHVLPTHVPGWYSNTPLPPATWKLMSLPRPVWTDLPCIWAPYRAGGHPGCIAGTQEARANRQKGQCLSFWSHLSFRRHPPPLGGTRTGGPSAQGWQQITPGQTQHSCSTTLTFTLCFEADCVELQCITSWNWILYT